MKINAVAKEPIEKLNNIQQKDIGSSMLAIHSSIKPDETGKVHVRIRETIR